MARGRRALAGLAAAWLLACASEGPPSLLSGEYRRVELESYSVELPTHAGWSIEVAGGVTESVEARRDWLGRQQRLKVMRVAPFGAATGTEEASSLFLGAVREQIDGQVLDSVRELVRIGGRPVHRSWTSALLADGRVRKLVVYLIFPGGSPKGGAYAFFYDETGRRVHGSLPTEEIEQALASFRLREP